MTTNETKLRKKFAKAFEKAVVPCVTVIDPSQPIVWEKGRLAADRGWAVGRTGLAPSVFLAGSRGPWRDEFAGALAACLLARRDAELLEAAEEDEDEEVLTPEIIERIVERSTLNDAVIVSPDGLAARLAALDAATFIVFYVDPGAMPNGLELVELTLAWKTIYESRSGLAMVRGKGASWKTAHELFTTLVATDHEPDPGGDPAVVPSLREAARRAIEAFNETY